MERSGASTQRHLSLCRMKTNDDADASRQCGSSTRLNNFTSLIRIALTQEVQNLTQCTNCLEEEDRGRDESILSELGVKPRSSFSQPNKHRHPMAFRPLLRQTTLECVTCRRMHPRRSVALGGGGVEHPEEGGVYIIPQSDGSSCCRGEGSPTCLRPHGARQPSEDLRWR